MQPGSSVLSSFLLEAVVAIYRSAWELGKCLWAIRPSKSALTATLQSFVAAFHGFAALPSSLAWQVRAFAGGSVI